MKQFKTWIEMLEQTSYVTKDKYNGMDIYPSLGNIKVDFIVLRRVIYLLNSLGHYDNIEEYFGYLNMVKDDVSFEPILNSYAKSLPEIHEFASIGQTNSFLIEGNIGSIVPGYNLVISKAHILSMSAMSSEMIDEYVKIIQDMRLLYQEIYHRKPIVFEHGANVCENPKASSIDHAHTHIVNHNYFDENKLINSLGLYEVSSIKEMLKEGSGKNYISYISPSDKYYIGEVKKQESQIMRKFIAQDIGKKDEWDWRKYPHLENSFETAKCYLLHKCKK